MRKQHCADVQIRLTASQWLFFFFSGTRWMKVPPETWAPPRLRHHIVIGLVNEFLLVPSRKQFIDSPNTLLTEPTKALRHKSPSYKQVRGNVRQKKNSITTKKYKIIWGLIHNCKSLQAMWQLELHHAVYPNWRGVCSCASTGQR